MTPFDELQREHEQLLEKAEVADVIAYIDRARTMAARIGDPRERDQLRANLRYWASYVYDRNGTYPTTTLLPAAMGKSIGTPATPQSGVVEALPAPRNIWPWLIGVAVVALLAAMVALPQLSASAPPAAGSGTLQSAGGTGRLWALPATTDLYDKPGDESAAQVLGKLQAGSQFYAAARTANSQWLKITTADGVSGWIAAKASGLPADRSTQLPEAAVVIVSTSTPTAVSTPTARPTETPASTATLSAAAGDGPTATLEPLLPASITPRPTPTRAVVVGLTPPPPFPPNALPLQVNHQVVTFGPSPFNADAWVIDVQLLATGGDNHYVFWVNGQRLDGDRYTIDGVACRAVAFTIGATSGGQAVRRDVTLKSPLTKCQ